MSLIDDARSGAGQIAEDAADLAATVAHHSVDVADDIAEAVGRAGRKKLLMLIIAIAGLSAVAALVKRQRSTDDVSAVHEAPHVAAA